MRIGVEQRCGNTEEPLDAKPLNCFSSLIAISMQVVLIAQWYNIKLDLFILLLFEGLHISSNQA